MKLIGSVGVGLAVLGCIAIESVALGGAGGGAAIGPIALCPTPTAAQCADATYLATKCGATKTATCATLNASTFDAAWAQQQAAAQTVIYSSRWSDARVLPSAGAIPTTSTSVLDTSVLFSDVVRRDMSALTLDIGASRHPKWEADGTKITSCGEYVYKKFYDYNRIDDMLRSGANQYEALYSALMDGTASLSKLPNTADNAWRTLNDREGRPLMFQELPAATVDRPKNIFFSFPADFLMKAPEYKSSPEFKAFADAVIARVKQGRTDYHYSTMNYVAFARSMHDLVAPYHLSAQAQARIDENNRRYGALVSDYLGEIAREMASQDGKTVPIDKLFPGFGGKSWGFLTPGGTPSGGWDPIGPGPLVDPTPLSFQGGAPLGSLTQNTDLILGGATDFTLQQTDFVSASPALARSVGRRALTEQVKTQSTMLATLAAGTVFDSAIVPTTMSLPLAGGTFTARGKILALPGVSLPVPTSGDAGGASGFCSPTGCDLRAIIAAMTELLEEEWAKGDASCLNLSNYACDWTERSFLHGFADLYEEREGYYARCIDVLGGYTGEITSAQFDMTKTTGLDAFEGELDKMEAQQRQITHALGKLSQDDPTRPNRIGRGASDSKYRGLDALGLTAGYDYDVGWSFWVPKPSETAAVCQMGAEAHANVHVKAKTPLGDLSVLSSESNLVFNPGGGGTATSNTIIAGHELYPGFTNEAFDTSFSKDGVNVYDVFSWSVPFFIGPFEIKVGAGIGTSAGYHAEASFAALALDCDPRTQQMTLDGLFEPKGSLDVTGSVSVGIPGVDVGVEGNVGLIGVGVPWHWNGTYRDGNVTLSDDVHLAFSELGGSLDAFAEIDLGLVSKKWSKGIATWEGLTQTTGRLYGNDFGPWELTALRGLLK